MSSNEFEERFDVLYNNITSNQAPGLNSYEKSVFLTKAQNEKVKNNFTANSKGNGLGQGFDDSAKRLADFSCLMKTASCKNLAKYRYTFTVDGVESKVPIDAVTFNVNYIPAGGTYTVMPMGLQDSNLDYVKVDGRYVKVSVHGLPLPINSIMKVVEGVEDIDTIDDRSFLYQFPSDVFIVINETVKVGNNLKQVVPLRFDDYVRLMSKPYKRPQKNQVWRLMNSGESGADGATKKVEIIAGPNDVISSYKVRYIRVPKPIIIGSLDGLTIDGYAFSGDSTGSLYQNTVQYTLGCELDPMLHEEILQRAVELAKIAWAGNLEELALTQLLITSGQRSE